MKLKNMTKEELEVLSYTDLTELILKENKKPMITAKIFKKICDLLELSDEEYASKIGDYYTSLTTDKRFTLLENAEWDLKDNHKVEIIVDDEDEDDDYIDEDDSEEEEEESADENVDESVDITDDEIDLDDSDDLEDLTIVGEEEMEDEL